jgi:hypothetical protein
MTDLQPPHPGQSIVEWIPWAIAVGASTLTGAIGFLFRVNFGLMESQIKETRADLVDARAALVEYKGKIEVKLESLLTANSECIADRQHLRERVEHLESLVKTK